jgi:PAS domain-containing protein
MLKEDVGGMISGLNGQQINIPGRLEGHSFWRQLVPGGLLSRVFHTLPWGILVVSGQGHVSFYNKAYAQLRGLTPGAFLGHPVEQLDRRQSIRAVLDTGELPSRGSVRFDRRINREAILPLWEGTCIEAVIVLVKRPIADPFL